MPAVAEKVRNRQFVSELDDAVIEERGAHLQRNAHIAPVSGGQPIGNSGVCHGVVEYPGQKPPVPRGGIQSITMEMLYPLAQPHSSQRAKAFGGFFNEMFDRGQTGREA